jgi:hypothetical protein
MDAIERDRLDGLLTYYQLLQDQISKHQEGAETSAELQRVLGKIKDILCPDD